MLRGGTQVIAKPKIFSIVNGKGLDSEQSMKVTYLSVYIFFSFYNNYILMHV